MYLKVFKVFKSFVKVPSLVKIAKIAPSASIVYQFLVFFLQKARSLGGRKIVNARI